MVVLVTLVVVCPLYLLLVGSDGEKVVIVGQDEGDHQEDQW